MIDSIVSLTAQSHYDFRAIAAPHDRLAYLFADWVDYYRGKWAIARQLQPKTILEIGVRFGYGGHAFVAGAPHALYTGIDIDNDSYGGTTGALDWARTILPASARFVVGNSQDMPLFPLPHAVPGDPPCDYYDLIHVDGQQDGDGTIRDLQLALQQSRTILVDGYMWTPHNFQSTNAFLYRYRQAIEFYGVIPGYAGDLLIRVKPEFVLAAARERALALALASDTLRATTSVAQRECFTTRYFLEDCAGHHDFKRTLGRRLMHPRLALTGALAEAVPFTEGARALDLGCGRGELTYHLAQRGFAVTAIDFSAAAITLTQAIAANAANAATEPDIAARIHPVCDSVTQAPLSGDYALAVAAELIEYLAPIEATALYARVAQHLAPAGCFIVQTPNGWVNQYAYPRMRRLAAATGHWLPTNPRSAVAQRTVLSEQSPARLRRQLRQHFVHVEVWLSSADAPLGGLMPSIASIARLRQAPTIMALASHQPIDRAAIAALFRTEPLTFAPSAIQLSVAAPATAYSQGEVAIVVTAVNSSAVTLASMPPYPVNLCYHWIDAATGEMLLFDGHRTPLQPRLVAGSTQHYHVTIELPALTRSAILRVTLVQEGVRWYDDGDQPTFADVLIEPLVAVPPLRESPH